MKTVIVCFAALLVFCFYLSWSGAVSLQQHKSVWPWEAPPGSPGTHFVCTPRERMFWDAPGPSYNCHH